MRILNIGSMNLDYVYTMDHIVQPGETAASLDRNVFPGGKGMNQSVALARAGADVYHGGMIGPDGQLFLDVCAGNGIKSGYIRCIEAPTGHAIIQIDSSAQNSILLYGGANRCVTEEYVDEVLADFGEGDVLLLQNEVNLLPYIVDRAYGKGLLIALNPSPFDDRLNAVDMDKIGIFILNEVEGCQITGLCASDDIIVKLLQMYPRARIVLTLGEDGAVYADARQKYYQPVFEVRAVDTTAAGDTFTGYFLTGLCEGKSIPEVLKMSAKAASIAVSRKGAVPSIPGRAEVEEALKEK